MHLSSCGGVPRSDHAVALVNKVFSHVDSPCIRTTAVWTPPTQAGQELYSAAVSQDATGNPTAIEVRYQQCMGVWVAEGCLSRGNRRGADDDPALNNNACTCSGSVV
jgi:hypothetical protein